MRVRNEGYALLATLSLAILAGCGEAPSDQAAEGTTSAPITISSSQTGTDGGFYYSFWTNNQGSCSMTLDGSNGYSLNWSNVGDFTAGKGWNPGTNNRVVCYSGTYSNSGGGGIGVYGWTKNPLIEYYIVDSPGNSGSPGQGTQVGSVTADGSTYTIWKHQQVNQPCITGNTCTFWQYISVRNSRRVGGTITTKTHFDAWAQNGMNLGSHDYQILLTESWSGSGNANVKISNGACSGTGGGGGGGGTTGGGGGGSGVVNGSISIAAGASSATGSFQADQYFSGGNTYSNTNTIDTSGIGNAAPASLFNNERYGAMTYTIPGFTAGSSYSVTLYFAETYVSSAGQRTFNVSINNNQVLSAFDIYSAAGGQNKAVAKSFTTTASSNGQIAIQLSAVTENPKLNGISIKPGSVGGGGGGGGGGGVVGGGGGGVVGGGGGGVIAGGGGGIADGNPVSINCGGSASGSFGADQYSSGGSTYTNSNTIDTSGVGSVPAAVFNSERYGAMTYTIPNRSGAQTVTLYFAETYLSSAGQRSFNVSINNTQVLSSFDIYSAAGGQNKAVARSFNTTANSSGQVVIQFSSVTENPKVNAITVTGGATAGGGGGGGVIGGGGGGTTGGGGGGNNYGWTNCKGYVGITFDDGPSGSTQGLVNALKQNNLIPVTFFNEGQNVASNSSLVKVEMQVGSVQNHSYSHQHMTSMSSSAVLDELNRTNQAIQNAGAPKPTLVRWPYGEHNGTTDSAASQAGLYGMTWDIDTQDWNNASTSAIVSANNQAQNGQVVLMHEWAGNTLAAIPTITSNLKSRGLCPGKIVNGRAVAP